MWELGGTPMGIRAFSERIGILGSVLVLGAALGVITAGRAEAAFCSGGPAWVYVGEGYHEMTATTQGWGAPGSRQGYRVMNGSDSNLAVQVKGFEPQPPAVSSSILTTPPRPPLRDKWVGFPLGPNGSFEATVDWGDVAAVPRIRVMNLGGRPAASVSFDC